jgi:hypothetical protein
MQGPPVPPALPHMAVPHHPTHLQGYIFKIMGGQDKQGFAMKQGVLTNMRVRLLMSPGDQGFRGHGRRDGELNYTHLHACVHTHRHTHRHTHTHKCIST